MKTEQNQQELSFEQLLEFNDFSLEDGGAGSEEKELDLNIENSQEEEKEEKKEESAVVLPEPKKEEAELTFTSGDTVFSDLIKEKLDSGEWEDMLIETPEGEEKLLSELGSIDKDTYKNLEKAIKDQKDEEFKTKYVDIDGLDEVKKRLISIVKNGDLELAKALFENPESLQEPFQGYDQDNERHNEDVLAWYYQNALGHSQSETRALVKSAKEDLSIDDKASRIVNYQRDQFYKNLENREAQILEEKRAEIERIKDYRKSLTSTFKNEGLSDNLVRKFVDVATKQDSTGGFEIDDIYDQWMSDPAKAKELIYFMLDKENYLKKATSEVKKNVQLDNLKKIKIIQDTTRVEKKKEESQSQTLSPLETINFDL